MLSRCFDSGEATTSLRYVCAARGRGARITVARGPSREEETWSSTEQLSGNSAIASSKNSLWRDVELLERRLHVRETIVRGQLVTPKSRSSRRTMEIGPRTAGVLDEVWKASRYRSDESLVFGHPALGTPVDPTKLSRDYMRPALKAAGITKPFRPWHDLRHTALTHEAAAGNPHAYVQAKAGHSQSTITDRYIHAAQVLFPGAAEKAEERMFGVAG
jgi:integrase